jgi:hypothetical protein
MWSVDESEEDQFSDETGEQYYAMPAYSDLRASLKRLSRARTTVVLRAAETDEEAARVAAVEYRESIQEVQAAVKRLQSRVPPDVFPDLALDLFSTFDLDSGMAFHDWETGTVIMGAE